MSSAKHFFYGIYRKLFHNLKCRLFTVPKYLQKDSRTLNMLWSESGLLLINKGLHVIAGSLILGNDADFI